MWYQSGGRQYVQSRHDCTMRSGLQYLFAGPDREWSLSGMQRAGWPQARVLCKVMWNYSLPEAEGIRIQVLRWMSGLSLRGCDGEGEPLYVKISTQGISAWESTDDQKRRDGRFFGVWAAALDMSELRKAVFSSRQELSALWEKCAWHRCLDRFWCCWHFLMMIELGWNTAETEICSGWQVFLL